MENIERSVHMNNLQVFKNTEFGEVRTIEENGKVLFCGSDCAKALGYSKPQNAISTHCRGALKRGIGVQTGVKADGTPAMQEIEMSFIPEGDLYRLITHSKLPSAEKFERWVFDEVLPSIRKHGGYIAGQETMSDDDLLAKALLVAQNKISEKNQQIERMRPKEIFADAVAASKSSILVGDLAKLLKQNNIEIGQKRLFGWMRENGYLIRQKGASWNMPTQKAMDKGLFEIKETTITHADGHISISKTVKVTGSGQVYFINQFLDE